MRGASRGIDFLVPFLGGFWADCLVALVCMGADGLEVWVQ